MIDPRDYDVGTLVKAFTPEVPQVYVKCDRCGHTVQRPSDWLLGICHRPECRGSYARMPDQDAAQAAYLIGGWKALDAMGLP